MKSRALLLYIAVVAAFGVAAVGHATAATVARPGLVSWPLIAIGFAAAEFGVVHLRLGRDSFSFTLHESIVVAAAILAAPGDTFIGLILGTTFVMLAVERMEPLKVIFNLSIYLLGAAAIVAVLHPLGEDAVGANWVTALVTPFGAGLVTMVLIAVAVRLAQGTPVRVVVRKAAATSMGTTLVSTVLGMGLAAVGLDGTERLLLLVPFGVVLVVCAQSFVRLQQRADQLELIHDIVGTLSEATELEPTLELLAARACETLTAERAAIVLRDASGSVRQVVVDARGARWETADEALVVALETATRMGKGVATIDRDTNLFADVFSVTDLVGPAHCIVAELAVGARVHGVIAVVQSRSAAGPDGSEAELLRSLALHAAVVLEATRLASAHDELRQRSSIDPTLGLPTVRMIDDALPTTRTPTALVYVSLQDFESVNDLHGFEVGDQLLKAVAGRLQNLGRPEDLVVRVGGDEFAIYVVGASDPFAIEAFGERVMQQLAIPFRLADVEEPVTVGARVGVGFSDDGFDDAATLIRRAHEHLRRRRLRRHLGVEGF